LNHRQSSLHSVFSRSRYGAARSLAIAEFVKKFQQRDGIAALTLGDGIEEHPLSLRVSFKGLVALACEDRDERALGQLAIELDPATHDLSRGDHHRHILAVDRSQPITWATIGETVCGRQADERPAWWSGRPLHRRPSR